MVCYFVFQETVCGIMMGCSSVRTTMTTMHGREIVDWNFTEGGGIAVVTVQILTGSMGTQILAKGLSGKPGEVMVTQ